MSMFRAIALGFASTMLASSPRSLAAQAPAQTVTFHLASNLSDAPVRVTRIMLGDKEVPLDTPVLVSGQWLRTVRVVAKNATNKAIVTGLISVRYPESGVGNSASPMLASSLEVGRPPHHWYLKKDGTERPRGKEAQATQVEVLPGDSMTFTYASVGGEDHSAGADVDQAAVTKIAGRFTQVQIQLNNFYFADESMWVSGIFYLPVPPPEIWKQAPAGQFFAAPTTPGQQSGK